MLLRLILWIVFGLSVLEASVPANAKPDLQKVYNEALSWSKSKLKEMPDVKQSGAIVSPSTTGVCRGQQDNKSADGWHLFQYQN